MTTKWLTKAAEKASSRPVFEPSSQDRRKNRRYFRDLLMGFDYPDGTYTIAAIPLVAVALYVGWVVMKGSQPFSPTVPSYKLTRAIEKDVNNDPR